MSDKIFNKYVQLYKSTLENIATHITGVDSQTFSSIETGEQTFLVRQDNKEYKKGDIIYLCEGEGKNLRTIGATIGEVINSRDAVKMFPRPKTIVVETANFLIISLVNPMLIVEPRGEANE